MSLTAGRPRKPAALKVLDGTARKDRMNTKAPSPKAPAKFPPPPRDLSAKEQEAWRTLAKLVEPLRVATAADIVAFRQMAVSLAIIDQARDELEAAGGALTYTLNTESGQVIRKRPEVEIIATYKKLLAVELSRFGLTPADRERVTDLGDNAARKDPLAEFTMGGSGAA